MGPDIRLALAASALPGSDGWRKKAVLGFCRDESDFLDAAGEFLRHRPVRRTHTLSPEQLLKSADAQLKRIKKSGINLCILGEPDYPQPLSLIADPPLVMFFRGHLKAPKAGVALVGTRKPSQEGVRQAFALSMEFAAAGYPVISGLAFGIDRAAHEGALAACGRTWAVLAGGLDSPSPMAHRSLASRILDGGGALVGEMPPGFFPAKYAFPRRNRILSGLCRGCIVVQAPTGSGALISADFALNQGRDVYVASSGLDSGFEGTQQLEIQGATVVSGAVDVLGDWGRFLDVRTVHSMTAPETGGDLARLMRNELDNRIQHYMGGWFEYSGT